MNFEMKELEAQINKLTTEMILNSGVNPLLFWTDSYKISHILFEIFGVSEIYSNFTPRFDQYLRAKCGRFYDGQYVVFGIQGAIKRMHDMFESGFFKRDKAEVIAEMKAILGPYIGQEKFDHFEALHDLGYLPVSIKSLDEGTVARVGTPFLTIRNTHPEFEWLPNYLETGLSMEIWKPLTAATVARVYRRISEAYALKTEGHIENVGFQNHDFHSRGAAGFASAGQVGAAFLTASNGTDNLAGLYEADRYYFSRNGENFLAGSVPAGEHSVTTSGILTIQERNASHPSEPTKIGLDTAERLYIDDLLVNKFPTGIVSYVLDSFDYWDRVRNVLPRLKETIMARDGKFVVRGDSGNPVHVIAGYRIKYISDAEFEQVAGDVGDAVNEFARRAAEQGYEVINFGDGRFYRLREDLGGLYRIEMSEAEAVGTIEYLYKIFGGTVNELGYRVLDSHIGMIYGDSITPARAEEILTRLEERKLVSTSIVFGVGSYSLGMLSRDDLGMAIKATNTIVDVNSVQVDKPIYKDPKTDASKKSLRGLIAVINNDGAIETRDNVSREEESIGLLTPTYENSKFKKATTIFKVREIIKAWEGYGPTTAIKV